MDVGDAVALLQHLEEVDEERVLDVDAQQGVNLAHVLRAKGLSGFQVNNFSTVGLYETSNRFYSCSSDHGRLRSDFPTEVIVILRSKNKRKAL